MPGRTVYYFCTRHFRGSASVWYNELVCMRLVAPDARIAALEKEYASKGRIHKIVYPSYTTPIDLAWEKKQVAAQEAGCKDILTIRTPEPKMQ